MRLKANAKITFRRQMALLDLPGCVLFAGAVLMLLLALEWGGVTYAWNSNIIISLFWGAGCAAGLFLAWEYRQGDDAMLPLKLVSNRIVFFAAMVNFMNFGGLYVLVLYLPLWFQAVKGASPLMSGVYYLPSVASLTISAMVTGFLG